MAGCAGKHGECYYSDPSISGFISTEDMVVMMHEKGIEIRMDGYKVPQIG